MSSSKKKQLRKEQYMTERQTAAAQEAKKLKRYTLTFWVVIALVICIFIGAVSLNPIKNVVYKNTDAITIGNHTISAVELNYFYVNAVSSYISETSSYLSLLGLDTTKPLNEQIINTETGATWADNFLTSAQNSIKSAYALYDLAIAAGHKLSDEEAASIDSQISILNLYAPLYGFSNANAYLRGTFGNGADTESYRRYLEVTTMATSYLSAYSESLEFSADAMKEFEALTPYRFNSFTYSTYYLSYTKFQEGETDKDGNFIYSDDAEKEAAIKAAREAAKKAAEDLAAGNYKDLDAFDEAIKELDKKISNKETSTAVSTKKTDLLYDNVDALFQDWMIGKTAVEGKEDEFEYNMPAEGDMTVIPYTIGSGENEAVYGYYVVRFGSCKTNDFAMKNVRHILVAFEGGTTDSSGNKTYSDEEKASAKLKAEKLLAQWEAGIKTEDSFAELANKESADTDSNTKGGLYKDVYPGMMISNFNDWCYDSERKSGDTGVIEGTSGYHVMYFVGDSETTFRNYMVENALRSETVDNWYNEQVEAMDLKVLTTKYVELDMVINHSH